jgi:hypothetical protein
MPVDRMQFPCWTCQRPQAMDARAWLGSADEMDLEVQRSPAGWPLSCCHVTYVGTVPNASPGKMAAALKGL